MIHVAVVRASVDMVASLLETNASANAVDDTGWSPLHLAVYINHADMVTSLLAASADPWQTLDLKPTLQNRLGSGLNAVEIADALGHEAASLALRATVTPSTAPLVQPLMRTWGPPWRPQFVLLPEEDAPESPRYSSWSDFFFGGGSSDEELLSSDTASLPDTINLLEVGPETCPAEEGVVDSSSLSWWLYGDEQEKRENQSLCKESKSQVAPPPLPERLEQHFRKRSERLARFSSANQRLEARFRAVRLVRKALRTGFMAPAEALLAVETCLHVGQELLRQRQQRLPHPPPPPEILDSHAENHKEMLMAYSALQTSSRRLQWYVFHGNGPPVIGSKETDLLVEEEGLASQVQENIENWLKVWDFADALARERRI